MKNAKTKSEDNEPFAEDAHLEGAKADRAPTDDGKGDGLESSNGAVLPFSSHAKQEEVRAQQTSEPADELRSKWKSAFIVSKKRCDNSMR